MAARLPFLLLFMLIAFAAGAQQYTVNGNASRDNCHCYTLTPNLNTQAGSVWNNIKIDLRQNFDFVFTVNLGCNETAINGIDGADGIAFVLQPINTSVGSTGSGLGFGGVSPSIGVTLDTYQNPPPDNDPTYDHLAIQRNGDLDHASLNNLAGPVQIISGKDNAEDCMEHSFRIRWNGTTHLLETYFDDVPRVSVINDLVASTFGGNPLVYWGFTGSTGGAYNLQKFCTALSPNFKILPTQKRCIGEAIQFFDSTVSFTALAKFYWDFGDGSNIDSINVNPIHTYAAAGDYTVRQKVRGADGCEEINQQSVRVGSKPVAGFVVSDSCVANAIQFTDTSRVAVGTINNWYWRADNAGPPLGIQNPQVQYSSYGVKNILLAVRSLEGCVSDTLRKTIKIRAVPVVNFTFKDTVCTNTSIVFTDKSTLADGLVKAWRWSVDGIAVNNNNAVLNYAFTTAGMHTVSLASTGIVGGSCEGMSVTKKVFIAGKPQAAIKVVKLCELQQVQLADSSYSADGVAIKSVWWDLGNGQTSTQLNPFATYNATGPVMIRHVAINAVGCISDTVDIPIVVNAKPVAKFGIEDILCNNNAVHFYDSSAAATGSVAAWSWKSSGIEFGTTPVAQKIFSAGVNNVSLIVTTSQGCISDAVSKSFVIKTTPLISMRFEDACKFTPVVFSAGEISNIGIDSWHWIFGDGAYATGNIAEHVYNANGPYLVKLYAISAEGCTTDTLQKIINIYGTNVFAGNDTIGAAGQPIPLHASGGLSYSWLAGAQYLSNSSIPNPFAIIDATQTFRVRAFTPEGCESFDEVTVKIYDGPDIYLPTAFTPNNDGLNDLYRGTFVGIKQFNYMRIFNRWGQPVFNAASITDGWDGRYKGIAQQPGSYIVIISGVDFKGKLITKKGSFMLLR